MSAELTHPLVLALADMPDVVAALLSDHVPNAQGECRACGLPGTGGSYKPFPCMLYGLAIAAKRIRDEREAER